MYKVLDLFCGAGGLSLGFTKSGKFEMVAAAEINANARLTYMQNHNINKNNMYEDVATIDYRELQNNVGEIDVVIGGPPCQGFSNANRQKNHMISLNNKLVKQYIRAIKELKPMAFVMENVNMLKSDIHRFFVEDNDEQEIEEFDISLKDENILLLESKYMFNEAIDIAQHENLINENIWEDYVYCLLNVIYKRVKNKDKLEKALEKYKNKLMILIEKLPQMGVNESIVDENRYVSEALSDYYNNTINCNELIQRIEKAIMIQRMLCKAKEISVQNVTTYDFTDNDGLYVQLKTFSVLDYIVNVLESADYNYSIKKDTLCAADFGVPQKRMRYVIIGCKKDICEDFELPKGWLTADKYYTVNDAISDLEDVKTISNIHNDNGVLLNNKTEISVLAQKLRDSNVLYNHIITDTRAAAKKRFNSLKQGQNFHDLSDDLKTNTYTDSKRTQNTIYLRLDYNQPSGTVVNVRKSMWIHPTINRAISIREAARLQSFPDSFRFFGTKDSQYQQVGNAVPPVLAEAIANHLAKILDNGNK